MNLHTIALNAIDLIWVEILVFFSSTAKFSDPDPHFISIFY